MPYTGILAGYGTTPPWCVSGVDFGVGVPTGTVLLDPAPSCTIAPALSSIGGSLSGCAIMTFSGGSATNATIDSYDFSLHGGIRVDIAANGMTIKRSKFKVGTNFVGNLRVSFGTTITNVTIQNSEFDGSGIDTQLSGDQGGMLRLGPAGTMLMEYCYLHDTAYQFTNASAAATGSSTHIYRYNVFATAGTGAESVSFTVSVAADVATVSGVTGTIQPYTKIFGTGFGTSSSYFLPYGTGGTTGVGGAGTYKLPTSFGTLGSRSATMGGNHGDWTQNVSSTPGIPDFVNMTYSYNLWVQNTAPAATQGISTPASAGNTQGFAQVNILNNTVVAPSPGNINSAFLSSPSWVQGNFTLSNNYGDYRGSTNGNWISWVVDTGPYSGTLNITANNKNMVTGATCVNSPINCP